MAVKIRLKRMGSKKKPFYRLVAADSRNARDGRFIETLGYYNPLPDPPHIKIEEENLFRWLDQGAIPTVNTESILRRIGVMQKWQLLKQGVKREDVDAKLAEMGIKTAPEATADKKKAAVKETPEQEAPAPRAAEDEAAGGEAPAAEAPKEEAQKAEEAAPAETTASEDAPAADKNAKEEESKKGD